MNASEMVLREIDVTDTVRRLDELIEIGKDVRECFEVASEVAIDPHAAEIVTRAGLQHARFVHELQREVRALGGDPSLARRGMGPLHRSWIALRAALRTRDTAGALIACECGEDQLLAACSDALGTPLPERTRGLLRHYRAEIETVQPALRHLHAARAQVAS